MVTAGAASHQLGAQWVLVAAAFGMMQNNMLGNRTPGWNVTSDSHHTVLTCLLACVQQSALQTHPEQHIQFGQPKPADVQPP